MAKYVWILFSGFEIEGVYSSEGNANYMKQRMEEFRPDNWFRIEKHEVETLTNSI